MNQFFAVGLKVLAAVGVGTAVYFGIDKAVNSRKNTNSQTNNGSNQGQPQNPVVNNNPQANAVVVSPESSTEPSSGEKIVNGLRVAQDVFGRAFSLCQNVAMAVENISRIFGNNPNQPNNNYGGSGYYSNDPYNNGYHDKYKDPPGYRRVSPFILEYVGGPVDNRHYNQHPTLY